MTKDYGLPAKTWGCSSDGRAPALQAGGRQFESVHLHQSWTGGSEQRRAEEGAAKKQVGRRGGKPTAIGHKNGLIAQVVRAHA